MLYHINLVAGDDLREESVPKGVSCVASTEHVEEKRGAHQYFNILERTVVKIVETSVIYKRACTTALGVVLSSRQSEICCSKAKACPQ